MLISEVSEVEILELKYLFMFYNRDVILLNACRSKVSLPLSL